MQLPCIEAAYTIRFGEDLKINLDVRPYGCYCYASLVFAIMTEQREVNTKDKEKREKEN